MNAIIVTEQARDALHIQGVEMAQTQRFRNGMVRLEVSPNLHRQLSLQIASGETMSDAILRMYKQ